MASPTYQSVAEQAVAAFQDIPRRVVSLGGDRIAESRLAAEIQAEGAAFGKALETATSAAQPSTPSKGPDSPSKP